MLCSDEFSAGTWTPAERALLKECCDMRHKIVHEGRDMKKRHLVAFKKLLKALHKALPEPS